MSLNTTKEKYGKGLIDKWQYIDEMYAVHNSLFDYSSFIKETNISKIEITDGKVVLTFRDSGLKFICRPNDKRLAPFDTLNFGSYEQEEFEMQCKLMEENYTIFDVGANFGWYALYAAKQSLSSVIYSFEPVPETYNYLQKNILLNNISNIRSFNFGFSSEEGSFTLYYDPKLSVNASLANLTGSADVKEVACKIVQMDTFVAQQKIKVDYIKCDVEGAELMVFQGGKKTIESQKPVIFTEMLRKWTSRFNYSPNEIIEFLKKLDYKCFILNNGKLKEFISVDENTKETNYFFLHKTKHASKIKSFAENV